MDPASRQAAEAAIRERHDSGDFSSAVRIAIERFGPEILGFLTAVARNEQDACEAFSQFSEDVWKGIPRFRWQSSFRTWAYTLARNALHRLRSSAYGDGRHVPLSLSPEISALEEKVRTATLPHLRTETKTRVQSLRERLDPEERMLLVLRVDKDLSWEEIAIVTLDGAADVSAVATEVTRLRKKFQRTKERLRELARSEGLLDGDDEAS